MDRQPLRFDLDDVYILQWARNLLTDRITFEDVLLEKDWYIISIDGSVQVTYRVYAAKDLVLCGSWPPMLGKEQEDW